MYHRTFCKITVQCSRTFCPPMPRPTYKTLSDFIPGSWAQLEAGDWRVRSAVQSWPGVQVFVWAGLEYRYLWELVLSTQVFVRAGLEYRYLWELALSTGICESWPGVQVFARAGLEYRYLRELAWSTHAVRRTLPISSPIRTTSGDLLSNMYSTLESTPSGNLFFPRSGKWVLWQKK